MPVTVAWRLVLAAALVAAIVASACIRAPDRTIPARELRRLVLCALLLYGVGTLASFAHHGALAAVVYGVGIIVAALAGWLSRGRDQGEPPSADEPLEPPPPEPDGLPPTEWARFEAGFREYERTHGRPPRVGGPS